MQKKAKWLSEEALQIAVKRREVKSKEGKETENKRGRQEWRERKTRRKRRVRQRRKGRKQDAAVTPTASSERQRRK